MIQSKMTQSKKLGPGDDLEMLKSPEEWPAWPVLPVKRPASVQAHWIDCGIVWVDHPTVFMVNLFELTTGTTYKSLEDDEEVVRHAYDSYEELLADGWVVD